MILPLHLTKPFNAIALTLLLAACDKAAEPTSSTEVDFRSVDAAAISADGEMAVIGSVFAGGSYWRLADGERLYNWNHRQGEESSLVGAAVSGDGTWAVTADRNTLVLWNTGSGAAERFWQAPGDLNAIALNNDATRALLGLNNNQAVVFNLQRGGILRILAHGGPVTSVAISADGLKALTGSADYTAKLWDLASGELLVDKVHQDQVQLVQLSPDSSLALSMSQYDQALVWRTTTGDTVGAVPLQAERLKRGLRFTAARFSADNRHLLTGRPDGIVELWQTDPLTRIAQWRLPKRRTWQPAGAAVIDVAFTGEGKFRAIASNGFAHLLELEAGATAE